MHTTPRAPIALITGATSGIGAEYARQLAARGYALVLVARDAARLAEVAQALHQRYGTAVEVIGADLATDAGVDLVVQRLDAGNDDDERAITLLVNNAGFGTKGSLVSGDRGEQEAMVRLHVLAVHRLTQAALAPMARRASGAIVTVSSVASFLTSPGNVNYCATKAYQRFAAQALAAEVAHRGIYVQAFCPGFTRTEFHQRAEMSTSIIPAVLWMDVESTVRASVEALERRRPTTVIPGRLNRLLAFLIHHAPTWLKARGTRPYRALREG